MVEVASAIFFALIKASLTGNCKRPVLPAFFKDGRNGSEAVKKFRLAAENGLLSPTLSSKGGEGEASALNFFTAFSVTAGAGVSPHFFAQDRRGPVLTFFANTIRKKCSTDPDASAIAEKL